MIIFFSILFFIVFKIFFKIFICSFRFYTIVKKILERSQKSEKMIKNPKNLETLTREDLFPIPWEISQVNQKIWI